MDNPVDNSGAVRLLLLRLVIVAAALVAAMLGGVLVSVHPLPLSEEDP